MWKLASLFLVMSFHLHAECVHESHLAGKELRAFESFDQQVFVDLGKGRFHPLNEVQKKLDPNKSYSVQMIHQQDPTEAEGDIPYYYYADMQKYLLRSTSVLQNLDYQLTKIGESMKGKDLHVIMPNKLDPAKKTIIMFGRQHGDESTQNWIIEGFLDYVLANEEFRRNFQLILYPMINPDGADKVTRYNSNRYDLNRVWSATRGQDKDEAKIIHNHLRDLDYKKLKTVVVLDMHGSFREDFIFRVPKSFSGNSFYQIQQEFIDELDAHDPYQAGNFQLSTGSPGMARIVMVRQNLNALTHETPRSIKKSHSWYRDLKALKEQGIALALTISQLYGAIE